MKVFKHRFLTMAMVLLLTVILAACGQNSGNSANDTAASNNGAAGNTQSGNGTNDSAEGQAATKSYKDFTGQEVEIPTNPERIVSVTHLGDLLAVGVKPIGAGSLALENSVLLSKELEGVENVGDISVEKVLALQPDLIMVPTYTPADIVEQLKKIAPVVTLATAGWEGIDPLEEVKTVGEMLGREQQAEEFITRYKQKAEEAKAKLSEVIGPNETVGTYSIWAKNFWVWPKTRDAGYNLYEMFGLKPQEKIEKEVFPTTGADISLEVVPEYAADHMFLTVYEPDGGKERAEEVMNGPVWKSIPAVQKNHVYLLNNKEFWMVDGLNLEKQIDILVDLVISQNQK
ncbi:ABC transporter substrate-binding protein [Paenibacillus sp. MBLB2552]|uniref:ABC transporter substrate-binding protein n=1 Tax=Paenibacillus mellifer TaxID=2937794 RepID=A0A9X2BQ74_9BACL|nr:ABC transporter substrate-binding protein [Paenibacillus mellifer]MCK8485915.1 ABC transporter substrate-binding protein [Paenibacillus mellifer]